LKDTQEVPKPKKIVLDEGIIATLVCTKNNIVMFTIFTEILHENSAAGFVCASQTCMKIIS
jgi:hypothetical protein